MPSVLGNRVVELPALGDYKLSVIFTACQEHIHRFSQASQLVLVMNPFLDRDRYTNGIEAFFEDIKGLKNTIGFKACPILSSVAVPDNSVDCVFSDTDNLEEARVILNNWRKKSSIFILHASVADAFIPHEFILESIGEYIYATRED